MITQIVFDDGGTDHQVHSAFRNRKFAAADSETGSGASRKTRDHAKPKIAHSKSDFLRNVFPAGFAPPPDVRAPPPLKYNGPSKHAERPSSSSHSREYVAVVTKSSRRPTGLQPMRSTPRFDFGPPLLEMRDSPPSTQGFDPSTGIGGLDELRYVAGPFFRVPEEGASGQVKTAVVRLDASETIDAEVGLILFVVFISSREVVIPTVLFILDCSGAFWRIPEAESDAPIAGSARCHQQCRPAA